MIWFSSDFHFGHQNIAGSKVSNWDSGYRDFDNVHEMNKCLTQTINKYVKAEDTLYFLGDFCFGGHKNTPTYRYSLVCQTIHLCKGNHDHHIDLYKDLFTSINDVIWCKERKDRPIFMSHYPHLSWHHSSRGVIMLHGHEHGSINYLNNKIKRLDVGVDSAKLILGEYRPFSIDEVIELNDKKAFLNLGHHNGQI